MSSFYSNRTSRQNRLPDLQDSPKTPENATSYCRRTSQENLLPHFQDSPKTPVHNDHSTCHTTRENLSNLESSPEMVHGNLVKDYLCLTIRYWKMLQRFAWRL